GPNTAYTARANDSAITGKVKARFVDANRFNAIHVKVVTENSNVYLLGIVTEKEGNDAAELARTTAGVRKVIKVFEYCKADDDAPHALIVACAPEVLVKGGDWPPDKIVGAKEVLARGAKVVSIPFEHARSTTALVERIRKG